MPEKAQDILNKIPTALKNLSVPEGLHSQLENYIENALGFIVQDEEFLTKMLQNRMRLNKQKKLIIRV